MPGLTGHLNGVCVYGLLFLPAAGQMNGEVYDGDGTWAGMSSSTGVMLQLYVPGANRSSGQRWWAVSTRHSIRLASVVSGLTVLFLPAAGRLKGNAYTSNVVDLYCCSKAGNHIGHILATAGSFDAPSHNNWEGYFAKSVRLASVVSGLACVCSCLLRDFVMEVMYLRWVLRAHCGLLRRPTIIIT